MKGSYRKSCYWGLAGAALLAAGSAQAQDSWYKELFGNIGIGGFFQVETAFRTTSRENPNNQGGNLFNGRSVERRGALVGFPLGLTLNDTKVREVPVADNSFNLTLLRSEVDVEWPLTNNIRLKATARGVFSVDRFDNIDDPTGDNTPPFDAVGILNDVSGPNFFEDRYDGNTPSTFTSLDQTNAQIRNGLQSERGTSALEFAGQDYLLDFPNLYLDMQFGPLLLRVGNQQIAWGDAIFFRILDVPNALDLRRHSVLDFVAEEFSDKRVPSLGVRASLTAPNPLFFLGGGDWEYDAFVQRFRPNILGNPNTPYNVLPSQFTVHNKFKRVDGWDNLNFGIRMKGPAGPVDLQFIAARVYNPAGVFHWTASGVEEGLPGTLPNVLLQPGGDTLVPDLVNALDGALGPLGLADLGVPTVGELALDQLSAITGSILARTPFEVDPSGINSAAEFSAYGGIARLDHFNGLNELIENFPAGQALGAQVASSNEQQMRQEDIFIQLTDGLRGHVARDYFRENNFGFGVTRNFRGEPGSLIDQLIGSFEFKYTPDRVFTPIDLSPERGEFIEEDEIEAALVFTKFQRISRSFPATFLVLQYLFRSESDLFGRHLSGYGGKEGKFPGQTNFDDDIGSSDPDAVNDAPSNYHAIAFAFQQPFPNRIFVADFATLFDAQGGLLVQPSLTWKPNRELKVQGFYNFIDTIYGNPNNNALETASFADEFTLRVTYQF